MRHSFVILQSSDEKESLDFLHDNIRIEANNAIDKRIGGTALCRSKAGGARALLISAKLIKRTIPPDPDLQSVLNSCCIPP